jgi:hypothetical protein
VTIEPNKKDDDIGRVQSVKLDLEEVFKTIHRYLRSPADMAGNFGTKGIILGGANSPVR